VAQRCVRRARAAAAPIALPPPQLLTRRALAACRRRQVNEGRVVAVGPGRRDKDGALLPLGAPTRAARSLARAAHAATQHSGSAASGQRRLRAHYGAAVLMRPPPPLVPPCILRAGVAKGDRVLLPEYGGQPVKLNDTECARAPRSTCVQTPARVSRRAVALTASRPLCRAPPQVHAVPGRGAAGRAEGRVSAAAAARTQPTPSILFEPLHQ
jgi:hypothetical protein